MTAGDDPVCETCGDIARRAVIRRIDRNDAEVAIDGEELQTVAIDLVPDVAVGDTVLVHQGVAIARVPPEEASR